MSTIFEEAAAALRAATRYGVGDWMDLVNRLEAASAIIDQGQATKPVALLHAPPGYIPQVHVLDMDWWREAPDGTKLYAHADEYSRRRS